MPPTPEARRGTRKGVRISAGSVDHGKNLEGHGQERIADKDGGGFVEGLVDRRPAARDIIVVHGGEMSSTRL